MAITGPIMTLDLGTSTGFAIGVPGSHPHSGSVVIKRSDEEADRAPRRLACFLRDRFAEGLPELLVYEVPLPAAAMLRMGNANHTVEFMWQLAGAVEAICGPFGVRTLTVSAQTARKHLTGKARWNGRERAKHETIKRCHALGLMPWDCRDDDRADAIAIWDWASATLGRCAPAALLLFGQMPAAAE